MKKNNKAMITALTALLAMGSLSSVLAEEGDEYRTGDTPIEFELGKGVVVDPGVTDPSDPHPGAETDFRIWYIPLEFRFGAGKLSATDESYDLIGTTANKVAVADIRNERDGWNLGASLSDVTNAQTESTLVGATISWDQEAFEIVDPTNITDYSETDVLAPTKVNINKEVTTIMKAEAGKGFGYTTANLSNVRLNVPAKQGEIGDYTGIVNWTLTKTPTVQE